MLRVLLSEGEQLVVNTSVQSSGGSQLDTENTAGVHGDDGRKQIAVQFINHVRLHVPLLRWQQHNETTGTRITRGIASGGTHYIFKCAMYCLCVMVPRYSSWGIMMVWDGQPGADEDVKRTHWQGINANN